MNPDADALMRVAFRVGREDVHAHSAIRLSTLTTDAATNKGGEGIFMQIALEFIKQQMQHGQRVH